MRNRNRLILTILASIIMVTLTFCYYTNVSADTTAEDPHVIGTNLLIASVMYNNITYSQDTKECFVWKYSDEKNHWHVLSVENAQVISAYIEADDDDESRHLILGCFGPTTTPAWR